MARYRIVDRSPRFLPVVLETQLMPGSFEHALDYLIDQEIDLSGIAKRYLNDETGAPAYDPAVMLKIVLLADSRGIVSSRAIERLCRENVLFMAISGDSAPQFTTIASTGVSMKSGEDSARLACALAQGGTVGEYGAIHRLTANTVRTHLKRALSKTGTHQQSQLVRLVGNLPTVHR